MTTVTTMTTPYWLPTARIIQSSQTLMLVIKRIMRMNDITFTPNSQYHSLYFITRVYLLLGINNRYVIGTSLVDAMVGRYEFFKSKANCVHLVNRSTYDRMIRVCEHTIRLVNYRTCSIHNTSATKIQRAWRAYMYDPTRSRKGIDIARKDFEQAVMIASEL